MNFVEFLSSLPARQLLAGEYLGFFNHDNFKITLMNVNDKCE